MTTVEFIPLGGTGEIGKNCNVLRQGDDLILVDCGLSFPDEDQHGVDIIVPDFTYLIQNQHLLKGIFLTHAHEDHVGSLPFLLRQLKVEPPVYCTEFTEHMVRLKFDDRYRGKKVDLRRIEPGKPIKVGALEVEYIHVTHSIPESNSVAVRTEHGVVLFTADFKFDFTPVDDRLTDFARLTQIAEEGIVLLLSDSTNADTPGWSPSESVVKNGFRRTFDDAPGRVLITTFSSNVHRMQQALDVAAETGRKVATAGRRIEMVVKMCLREGYMKAPERLFIPIERIRDYADDALVILTTGSQGEPLAALNRMSREEYSRVQIKEGDTVLFSARPIPGNEAAIWRTVNRLVSLGARVIVDRPTPIHSSGHGYQEELKMMMNLTRPFYIAPVHGEPRHQVALIGMARAMGHAEHRLFRLENGQTLRVGETSAEIGDDVPHGEVPIGSDGEAISDKVLGERARLRDDGVIIVSVHVVNGRLAAGPTLTSRGFAGDDRALRDAERRLADELDALQPAELQDSDTMQELCERAVRQALSRDARSRPLVVVSL